MEELALAAELGVTLRVRDTANYPTGLREIPDPPAILYVKGTYEPRDELAIAIVGSRQCSIYGKQQAEKLASSLARAGITIISGLARGIDACAHRGALKAGGRTIAVCATGLSEVYPPEHAELAQEITEAGCLISESPLRRSTMKGIFPQRNRLISGLSLGVIVVEANRGSGSLHTARHAMEQGREVFAVPGRIDSLASQGCHDLIRDGATLVRGPEDILESLGPLIQPVQTKGDEAVHAPRELLLNDQEREVLNLVRTDPQHIDEICASEPAGTGPRDRHTDRAGDEADGPPPPRQPADSRSLVRLMAGDDRSRVEEHAECLHPRAEKDLGGDCDVGRAHLPVPLHNSKEFYYRTSHNETSSVGTPGATDWKARPTFHSPTAIKQKRLPLISDGRKT